MKLLNIAIGALSGFAANISASAVFAQPIEIRPELLGSIPEMPTMYRAQYGLTSSLAEMHRDMREKARKSWVAEADRIARSRQDVVRDEGELYVHLVPGRGSSVVFRNVWGFDPGVLYSYQGFDEVGQFHIVLAEIVENDGYFLLISAKTGLVYKIYGMPTYSPDNARFFAQAFNGMGCIEGIAIYRYQMGKLFKEAELAMGCDYPCDHHWFGPNEVESVCTGVMGVTGSRRTKYRLINHDGVWTATKSADTRAD